MANTTVKIPEKHYVAMQARSSECPVGFLVPWGTDAAAIKRMATADDWAQGRSWGKQKDVSIEPKTINNDLMSGFTLANDALRHGQSGSFWRIVDPRGFELEINAENMANVIRLTTIENGEILSRCVWARRGANNVLLPEESEEYQDALRNTARVKTSVSIRDVNIGDKVLLQNGEEIVYLGKLYTIFQSYGDEGKKEGEWIQFANKKRHYFYAESIDSSFRGGPAIKSVSAPKLSKIIEPSFMEIKDSAAFINEKVQAFEVQVVTLRDDYDYRFVGVTESLMDYSDIEVELEPIFDAKATADGLIEIADKYEIYLHSVAFVAKMANDIYLKVRPERYNHGRNGKDFSGDVIHIDRLVNEAMFVLKTTMINSSHRRSYNSTIKEDFNVDEAEWFWPKIVITDPKTNEIIKMKMI